MNLELQLWILYRDSRIIQSLEDCDVSLRPVSDGYSFKDTFINSFRWLLAIDGFSKYGIDVLWR